MSSTILYRAFGFRQYQCLRTTTADGLVTLHLRQDPRHDRCSHCQSPDVIRHGAEERTIRTVPIGGQPSNFDSRSPASAAATAGSSARPPSASPPRSAASPTPSNGTPSASCRT